MCSECGTPRIVPYHIDLDIVVLAVRKCPDCSYLHKEMSFRDGTPSLVTLRLAFDRMRSKFPDENLEEWHKALEYVEAELFKQTSNFQSEQQRLKRRMNDRWEAQLLKDLQGDLW